MSNCTHDLSERETAVADGYCPMCLVSTIEKLQTRVEELVGLYEKSNDALSAQVIKIKLDGVGDNDGYFEMCPAQPPEDKR